MSSSANGPSGAAATTATTTAASSSAQQQSVAVQGEEFQRYLEKSGVIDALTKVLVGLYESAEKPSNAIESARTYTQTTTYYHILPHTT